MAVAVAFGVAGGVIAQSDTASSTGPTPAITFPIADLGNCESKTACKAYCNAPEHVNACVLFGETHGLMTHENTLRVRKIKDLIGPGGCKGGACKEYCSVDEHRDACLQFAEEHGLMKKEDRFRKVERYQKYDPKALFKGRAYYDALSEDIRPRPFDEEIMHNRVASDVRTHFNDESGKYV